ncbi:pantoate--beta-alanine ligase [Pontibacter akesuensis]|uniref:Pantothenate synthetase n=1 Tax=Pontibacter akesuensis TaxID=388950 RepID=A0A1I7HXY3_9BACT|nr:pantoate--beta-alanine ligase [Pontibacter akesuensis]GHA64150.1 pantothenate synthetase [Pontibacter akesuensis]SFU65582.1 pantothenate synthetase [Pontibacter akesuensis]
MEVIQQVNIIRERTNALRSSGKSIGFVPTMGALHEGHLQLLRASVQQNDVTVCSIFVNPTQFNNPDDYKLYPRTMEQDVALLQSTGCDILFAPVAADVYPQQPLLQFSFGPLEAVMEGAHRPGHFNGVATIVSKLFHMVQPHRAYFGQKDLQQVAIVKQLVQALSFDVELVRFPTVREADGLAMSSRNKRLNPEQRQTSAVLYEALQQAKEKLGRQSLASIKAEAAAYLQSKGRVEVEYFEIADADTLQPLEQVAPGQEVALCIAAFVGPVRLIDNMLVNLNEV